MTRFVLTQLAEDDLGGIWDYIADDSLDATNRVLKLLERTMDRLAKRPALGHWREELADKRHRFFSCAFLLDCLPS